MGLMIMPRDSECSSSLSCRGMQIRPAIYYVFLQDRFAFKQSRPPIDPQQDWFIISGENMDGYTVLQFWRKWITCDERDRNIQVG